MNIKIKILILLSCFCYSLSAQWEPEHTGGPEGGTSAEIISNDQYTFYASRHYLYRTADGEYWEELPIINLYTIATTSGLTAAIQFYGTKDPFELKRIVVSEDDGSTWLEKTMPPPSASLLNMFVNSEGIYFPEHNQPFLFKSIDKGNTWEKIPMPGLMSSTAFVLQDTIYGIYSGQLWQFNTTSNTWTEITPDFGNGETVKKLTKDGQNWMAASSNAIYVSSDNGQTWEQRALLNEPLDSPLLLATDHIYYFTNDLTLYFTDDFGLSWKTKELMDYAGIFNFQLGFSGNRLLMPSYNQGVFRFDPATELVQHINTGLNAAAIYDVAVGADEIWAATGTGLFSYNIFSKSWTSHSLPIPNYFYNYKRVAHNGQQYVATIQEFGQMLYYSQDNGTSWDSLNLEPYLFSGSDVDGMHWLNHFLFLNTNYLVSIRFNILSGVLEFDPQVIFPVPFNGRYYSIDQNGGVQHSFDAGDSWQPVNTNINGLARLYSACDRLFAVQILNNQFYLHSSENGELWSNCHNGLPEFEQWWLDDKSAGNIWCRKDRYFFFHPSFGLYQSLDNGQSWFLVHKPNATDMEFYNDDIYYGDFGSGILTLAIPNLENEIIRGIVYYDINNSGLKDSIEPAINFWRLERTPQGDFEPDAFTYTMGDGRYAIFFQNQDDTLRVAMQSNFIEQINPPFRLTTGQLDSIDFGVYLTPNILDVALQANYMNIPRPGFDIGLKLTGINVGTLKVSGSIEVKLDPFFQYISADPPPNEIVGTDSLVWHYIDWSPFATRQFNVKGKVSSNAMIGSTLQTLGRILPIQSDTLQINNEVHLRQLIVGSYDPNDKQVTPIEGITAEAIAEGEELIYTIRFQNTGNHEAEKVRITDQLDTALLLHTFRLLDASHEITQVDLLSDRILQIIFDGIALPDSNANESESHGYVTFAIQRKKDYNPDFKIHNTASIYFDFNEPVITNTVTTELYTPVVSISVPEWGGYERTLLSLFPNPAIDQCKVSAGGYLKGPGILIIRDIKGRTISTMDWENTNKELVLLLAELSDGLYILEAATAERKIYGKLVVHR